MEQYKSLNQIKSQVLQTQYAVSGKGSLWLLTKEIDMKPKELCMHINFGYLSIELFKIVENFFSDSLC
jgi:hypothetical protein